MHDSDISVIIPLFNCARFITEAVNSVLGQTVKPREIIVVDDGSTDESIATVPRHPLVRVEARPHAGIAPTLNHGVSCAKGSILAFLDSDDLWLPTKLERQLARLNSTAEDELIFCHAQIFREGDAAGEMGETVTAISKSALLLRRRVFERIGPFPEEPGAHDFIAWYARACELRIASHVIPDLLHRRRIHGQNDGILNHARQRANYFASLKKVLERRRQSENE